MKRHVSAVGYDRDVGPVFCWALADAPRTAVVEVPGYLCAAGRHEGLRVGVRRVQLGHGLDDRRLDRVRGVGGRHGCGVVDFGPEVVDP
jgi:hypothetical protein